MDLATFTHGLRRLSEADILLEQHQRTRRLPEKVDQVGGRGDCHELVVVADKDRTIPIKMTLQRGCMPTLAETR